MREPRLVFSDAVGPSYDLKFVSLRKHAEFKSINDEQLQKLLLDVELLEKHDSIKVARLMFPSPGALFAAQVSFSFEVSGEDGGSVKVEGLKPFGDEFKKAGGPPQENEKYVYRLSLRSPNPIGLELEQFLELRLPGLPAAFLENTPFAGDPNFVTDKRLWSLKSIQRVTRKK
jgi:hypothetical protein